MKIWHGIVMLIIAGVFYYLGEHYPHFMNLP